MCATCLGAASAAGPLAAMGLPVVAAAIWARRQRSSAEDDPENTAPPEASQAREGTRSPGPTGQP